jgi:TolA-binding protein/LysM repeat protein
MKWKVFLALFIVVVLAIGGVYGYIQWQELQKGREIRDTVNLATGQMEQGNHPRAQQHFERILEKYPNLPEAAAIYARLAESYSLTGDTEKALACWTKIRESHPDSPRYAAALAALARAAYDSGKREEAARLWDEILERYKGSDSTDEALLGKALMVHAQGESKKSKEMLEELRTNYPNSKRMAEIEKLLGVINLAELYAQDQIIHTIGRGDNLESIARKYSVSAELLARVNNVSDARNLRVGRRMRIPQASFSIEVNKSDNTLTLLDGGKFFKKYIVRTGAEDWLTPTGAFRIQSKVKNPQWNDPKTGRTIPPNDPENDLGTRWMAFDGSIGFHGTNKPQTIGQYASNGCVGMFTEDVEELFDLVPLGTPVKITGRKQKAL